MLNRLTAKTKAVLVVGTFALAAYAAPAAAASNALLSFDGIAGSSTLKNFKGAIEIDSFSWGVSSPGGAIGGGSGSGKPILSDFTWSQLGDTSTTVLFADILSGKHLKTATLSLITTGANPVRYFDIVFSDVSLTSLITSGGSSGKLDVAGAFAYGKLALSYWPQNNDGSLGTPITASYDLATNTGSPAALLAVFSQGVLAAPSAPIPEPESYAMLLAGLGLIGTIARHRLRREV